MWLTSYTGISAYLTKTGRQLLADNSTRFNITKFKYSDDEIDYSLFDGSSLDAANIDVLNTPILESCTEGRVPPAKYELFTNSDTLLNVARLDCDVETAFIEGKQSFRPVKSIFYGIIDFQNISTLGFSDTKDISIRTLYGNDDKYFVTQRSNSPLFIRENAISSIPSSDPYETRQNQTQCFIDLVPTVQNVTTTSINPADYVNLPKLSEILAASSPGTYRYKIVDWENKIISLQNENYFDGSFAGTNGFGLSLETITILGSATKSSIQIKLLVYNKQTLSHILVGV